MSCICTKAFAERHIGQNIADGIEVMVSDFDIQPGKVVAVIMSMTQSRLKLYLMEWHIAHDQEHSHQ